MKSLLLALIVVALTFVSAGTVNSEEPSAVSYRQSIGFDLRPRIQTERAVAQPQAVIGVDEREPILDTTQYPFSAIAHLTLTTGSGSGSCTGTFIGPDVLLTAAHCLWGPEEGFTQDILVAPGKDGFLEPFGSEHAYDWVVPTEWIDSAGTDTLWDFGIIVMFDGTMGNNVGWLAIANMLTNTLARSDFNPAIIGYPGDIGDGTTMVGNSKDAFKTVDDFILEYEIDTAPGQSGSAVFSLNLQEYFLGYIVAIHTTGGFTENHGTRIEEITLDYLLGMCEEFVCSMEAYTEETGTGPIWGDIDCNGDLGTRDIQSILRIVLTQNPLSQTLPCTPVGGEVEVGEFGALIWGDVDCNGEITTRDNQALLRNVLSQPPLSQTQPCPGVREGVVIGG